MYGTFCKCDATKRLPSLSKFKHSMLRNVNFKLKGECLQKLMVLNLQSYHFNLLCGIFCERDAYESLPSLSKFKDTILRNINLKFNKQCSQTLMVLYLQWYHFSSLCNFNENDVRNRLPDSLKNIFSERFYSQTFKPLTEG